MSFTVDFRGRRFNTDEMTLDEIASVEQICSTPWSELNPLHSVAEAKALLAVFALRDGASDDEAVESLAGLTVGDIKGCFEYDGADLAAAMRAAMERHLTAKGGDSPLPRPQTRARRKSGTSSRRGSTTAPASTTGRRTSPGSSE